MLLCAGGYGFVFIAQDVRTNKLYALKVSDKIITRIRSKWIVCVCPVIIINVVVYDLYSG